MIAIEDLRVAYRGIPALRGVSLAVARGEIVSVIGANGAGKSTLLNSIAGLVTPTGGQMRLESESIIGSQPEDLARAGISLVPEGRHIFASLTVLENLRLGLTMRRGRSERRDVQQALERFPDLQPYLNTSAGRLSGGEQQQLAIARALLTEPRLLLLDEPSLGLAPLIVRRVFEVLADLREDGMTVLLVEQFAEQAHAIADRTYVLRTGEVVLETQVGQVVGAHDFEKAYFGVDNHAEVPG